MTNATIRTYLDNGSTSLPKAPGVSCAIKDFLDNQGYNAGRGAYRSSTNIAMDILHTRELLADFFVAESPRHIIFTSGLTASINMVLSGYLKESDHIITTSMEHNSVMRPLHALQQQEGISYSVAHCDSNGVLDPAAIDALIRPQTRAVIMTHASNVCGTIMPINQVSQICQEHGLHLIVDAAQSAGVLPINVTKSKIDALLFPGHKGLLGPQGIGGMVLSDEFAAQIEPIIWGGTGSRTQDLDHPDMLPDKFESGTQNIPGILGLRTAIQYLQSRGIDAIAAHERKLNNCFRKSVAKLDGVKVMASGGQDCVAITSLDFPGRDNAHVATLLDRDYEIMTRCGMHCAPAAHKTLGTYPAGTLRASFGHGNTTADVTYIVDSLAAILDDYKAFNPQDS